MLVALSLLCCRCLGPDAVEVALARGPVPCIGAPPGAHNCVDVDCTARCRYADELGLEVRASLVDGQGNELDYRSDGYYCDGSWGSTTRTTTLELRFVTLDDGIAHRVQGAHCSWETVK